MSEIFRQWLLSLHRKTTKLLNMALILPILKILQKYNKNKNCSINIVPADIFCCITFVLKWKLHFLFFFYEKSDKMSLKLPRQN